MFLALLALLAFNDVVSVGAGQWKLVPFKTPNERSRFVCEFMLMGEGAGVRAALLTEESAAKLRQGHLHGVLLSTGYEQKGHLRRELDPGRYAILIDNRMEGRYGAEVWLRVAFEPVTGLGGEPGELSPQRRAAVIAISALFFLSVAAYTWRRLLRHWPRK
ncbi:MAG TPA: hypothetical protein VN428_04370 [Bryobacteraceae bacterium]|nr:hypothetical protein [Bryobacteraceae bacterium]